MAFQVQKNEKYTVDIVDVNSMGNGVAKIEQYPLFIPNALKGETVEVKVVKTLKKYGFAKILNWIEKSPHRVEPPCDVYHQCGGCQLQHMSYEAQLQQKWQTVRSSIDRIGGLPDVPVHPVKGMENPWHYRNKTQVPFQVQDGRVVWGFYRPRTHEVVPTTNCLIQSEASNHILQEFSKIAPTLGLTIYDEVKHSGILRHLIVRTGDATGEIMVVLVVNAKELKQQDQIVAALIEIEPRITSIVINENRENTNVILGRHSYPIYGPSVIRDELKGLQFEISANSFYQVNHQQTEVLYSQALEYAQLTGKETVIDAYCGIGTISLFLAPHAKEVYGVEIVEQAIIDAKRNAALNEITNAHFTTGKTEEVVPAWYAEGKTFDVLVVDPPRKGCDPQLLETILTHQPERVVYVSCDPATLARDLKILHEGGYQVKEIQPVDMFGHSTHVECVALLSRV